MDNLNRLLRRWTEERLLPGAVVDVRLRGEKIFQAAYGSAEVTDVYDAASLTKVAVTLPSVLLLLQSSKLSLQDPVRKYLPEFRHAKVTIEHCLRHVTGLPAGVPGFRERYATRDIRQEILAQELVCEPGERVLYSDLGFILIGWIVERISGISLDSYIKDRILNQLNMADSCFNPPLSWRHRIAPTEWDGSKYLIGEVHDETCYRLGGVSGNAGLFTTAEDLARYAQMWLDPEAYGVLTRASVEACLASPQSGRGLGWQVKDGHDETFACGESWPIGSFGHTGYTGTSLWIDPSRELAVVFLTNAVHDGRDNPIRTLRPLLHKAVMASLAEG
ncbi:serine hydrolase domain-containing protein [Cohnella lubricantis]|uniref:Beta-lactamase family protein n=1 Tax=Cohnella lubricantis TaxID=2163172 RepID=A0A841TIX6_9BACL|nr:serine hydrolase domain-containing protein [Cohnella lubricantis]MBB6679809.1 beta-lactamase family protein [Cohnella lubricantis]MBP2118771.1 CubicO group peptidase (beta-lactamase class C family) [Cohnella lubricantis]